MLYTCVIIVSHPIKVFDPVLPTLENFPHLPGLLQFLGNSLNHSVVTESSCGSDWCLHCVHYDNCLRVTRVSKIKFIGNPPSFRRSWNTEFGFVANANTVMFFTFRCIVHVWSVVKAFYTPAQTTQPNKHHLLCCAFWHSWIQNTLPRLRTDSQVARPLCGCVRETLHSASLKVPVHTVCFLMCFHFSSHALICYNWPASRRGLIKWLTVYRQPKS